jgi:hypothetical protein
MTVAVCGFDVRPETLTDDSVVWNVVSVANPSIILHAKSEKAAWEIYNCLQYNTVD